MKRQLKRYDFYSLMWIDGEFNLVLITYDYFFDIELAKIYANSSFIGEDSVIVILDLKSNFHFYHPRYRVWYKNLTDEACKLYFNFLIPGELKCKNK